MQRIGRYEIIGELGRGAMGIVFRAQDPAIGRTVAIKTIRFGDIVEPDEKARLHERLMREARSAGILAHPNIVTIYDIGEEGDLAYIAMEFIRGSSLDHLMREPGALDASSTLRILSETAAALDYAHGQGIVHRDVKPANILLTEGGMAKMADFGVAKIVSQQVTQVDMILGTPSYMSPEQVEAKKVSGQADQFALGVIAYELLTGEKPFLGDNLPSLLFKIVHEPPAPPHLLNPTLNAAVGMVLSRAMDKRAAERYPTCGEFVAALANSLNSSPGWKPQPRGSAGHMETVVSPGSAARAATPPELGATTTSIQPAPSLPPARKREEAEDSTADRPAPRRRRWVWATAAAVALVTAALAWMFLPQFEGRPAAEAQRVTAATDKPSPMPPPAPAQSEPPVTETAAPKVTESAPSASPTPAKPPSAPAPAAPVLVEVLSNPSGAAVTIDDGAQTCTTPCPVRLTPGRHALKATLAGHRTAARLLNVPDESSVTITFERSTGTLMVKTTPPGASVYVDGQLQQARTPAVLTLVAGKHKLELRREGNEPYTEEIEIKDQVTSTMEVNW